MYCWHLKYVSITAVTIWPTHVYYCKNLQAQLLDYKISSSHPILNTAIWLILFKLIIVITQNPQIRFHLIQSKFQSHYYFKALHLFFLGGGGCLALISILFLSPSLSYTQSHWFLSSFSWNTPGVLAYQNFHALPLRQDQQKQTYIQSQVC